MNPCLCICALYVCACCASIQAQRIQNENGFDLQDRKAQIGQKATTKLLQGAEKTASEAVSPKTYKKHGTYQDAVKDFFSVDPRSVSKFGSSVGYKGMSGIVGDRILVVKSRRDFIGKPVLEIYNYKSKDLDNNIDIISYID